MLLLITSLVLFAVIIAMLAYNAWATHAWHKNHRGRTTLSESEHFRGHLFYYNPEDLRIFVPKQTGGGYTVNFANPWSVIAGLLIIVGFGALAVFS